MEMPGIWGIIPMFLGRVNVARRTKRPGELVPANELGGSFCRKEVVQ